MCNISSFLQRNNESKENGILSHTQTYTMPKNCASGSTAVHIISFLSSFQNLFLPRMLQTATITTLLFTFKAFYFTFPTHTHTHIIICATTENLFIFSCAAATWYINIKVLRNSGV